MRWQQQATVIPIPVSDVLSSSFVVLLAPLVAVVELDAIVVDAEVEVVAAAGSNDGPGLNACA